MDGAYVGVSTPDLVLIVILRIYLQLTLYLLRMPSFIPETEENDENDIEGSDPGGSATGEPVIQIARTFDTWVLQLYGKLQAKFSALG